MLFDLYVAAPGWLQRLDPRAKLGLLALGALLLVATPTLGPLALLALGLHLALITSRVPRARIGWLAVQLRPLLLALLLLTPFVTPLPGREWLHVGPVVVTDASVLRALTTVLRLWATSLLTMALLFTTRQDELVRGLVALGLPYRWGLTLALALRFIPSFTQQVTAIQEAQQARGWDPAQGELLKRLRGVTPVLVALFIHAFRTVDTLTMAMTARGAGRSGPRTQRRPLRFATRDWAALGLGVAGAALWAAWLWG